MLHLWLRAETNADERRTPLVPGDAAGLVADGVAVTVEESATRAFPLADYAAAGCRTVPADSWPDAPADTVVLGLKEPSAAADALVHRHVYFGHAYKGQAGADEVLGRYAAGGGTLLDLEELADGHGRRVVAFGFWAGYVGAALAVLHHRGELEHPLRATTRPELDARLRAGTGPDRALVVGALGRSGRGATEALATAGVPTTRWDVEETRELDLQALLAHDILVNTIVADQPGPAFVGPAELARTDRRLATVADVTCDVTSAANRLPVNDRITTWADPVRRLHAGPAVLDIVAVDNLPSLLPREASVDFSAGLTPHLRDLATGSPVWDRAAARFRAALSA